METTTIIDTSATPAKGALLAHLHNNPRPWFAALSGDELRAYIEAEIASARCGPAPVRFDPGDDDDEELVEPAPVPAPQRRQRKRSLAKVCEVARKVGANHVIVDGVVIAFSPAAAVPESNGNEFDEWMAKHAH
jgi:hypothetical protein